MTQVTSDTDLFDRVRELTGYDATEVVGTGVVVSAHGIGGSGVTTLIRACRTIDPSTTVREGRWGHHSDDVEVGIALMVVDPSSSVGAEEKSAIDELRRRFGVVALVCTKIDTFWEWPRRLREHRELLDPRHELPVFAVSPNVALDGAVEESGVRAVLNWIQERFNVPDKLRRDRARAAAALAALGATEDDLARDADPEAATKTVDHLTHRRRDLLELRDRGRADRLATARSGLARVRGEAMADVATSSRALASAATERCARVTGRDRDDYVRWLTDQMSIVHERIEEVTDERIDNVRAVALLGVDAGTETSATPLLTADDTPEPAPVRAVPTGRRGGEDALLVLIGASTGLGVGRLIVTPMAAVRTLQWISMPLTLVLGIAVAALVIRVRRTAALRAELRSWSTEQLAAARGRLEQSIGLRLAAAEPRLVSQITRFHDRRARGVSGQIARIDDRVRELRSGVQASEQRLRQLRAVRRDVVALAAGPSEEHDGTG